MSITRLVSVKLTVFCILLLPLMASAQVAVSGAEWTSVINFKFCSTANCETFRNVKLSANSIKIGQDISVLNLDTGTKITEFLVKSIKYGRQVKMCWLGDSDGLSETYITVGGCKM